MITRNFTIRLIAVLALAFSAFGLVAAQDAETETATEISGAFVQNIESGSFVELEDGSYTLTLSGVAEYTPWQFMSPELDAGRFSTNLLALYWAAAEELSTTAVLETEELVITLTLSAPSFDLETGMMTYSATVDSVAFAEPTDSKEAAELAMEFGASTLFITMDETFVAGINEGSTMMGVRGPDKTKNCSAPTCNSISTSGFAIR